MSQSILSEVREERKDERLDERMSSRGIASINDNEKQMVIALRLCIAPRWLIFSRTQILSSKDAASFVGDAATSLEVSMRYVFQSLSLLRY